MVTADLDDTNMMRFADLGCCRVNFKIIHLDGQFLTKGFSPILERFFSAFLRNTVEAEIGGFTRQGFKGKMA